LSLKRISIIGSTGSIGTQTLDIARAHTDLIAVRGLAAGKNNLPLLCEQIKEFRPALVSVPDDETSGQVRAFLSRENLKAEVIPGMEGLIALAEDAESDVLVTAVVGFLGVKPTLAAIKKGKTIALSSEEFWNALED